MGIDINVVIICLTALIAVEMITRRLPDRSDKPARWLGRVKKAVHLTAVDEKADDPEPDEIPSKKSVLDFTNLDKASEDDLIKEYSSIESRGKTPHSMGIVEKKQKLTEELYRRDKAREKREGTTNGGTS